MKPSPTDKTKLEWYENKYGPYIEKRGLHNYKNLFKKPNMYEWTILFMIILSLFQAWAYQHDTQLCKNYIQQDITNWQILTNGTGRIEHVPEQKPIIPPELNLTILLQNATK